MSPPSRSNENTKPATAVGVAVASTKRTATVSLESESTASSPHVPRSTPLQIRGWSAQFHVVAVAKRTPGNRRWVAAVVAGQIEIAVGWQKGKRAERSLGRLVDRPLPSRTRKSMGALFVFLRYLNDTVRLPKEEKRRSSFGVPLHIKETPSSK